MAVIAHSPTHLDEDCVVAQCPKEIQQSFEKWKLLAPWHIQVDATHLLERPVMHLDRCHDKLLTTVGDQLSEKLGAVENARIVMSRDEHLIAGYVKHVSFADGLTSINMGLLPLKDMSCRRIVELAHDYPGLIIREPFDSHPQIVFMVKPIAQPNCLVMAVRGGQYGGLRLKIEFGTLQFSDPLRSRENDAHERPPNPSRTLLITTIPGSSSPMLLSPKMRARPCLQGFIRNSSRASSTA